MDFKVVAVIDKTAAKNPSRVKGLIYRAFKLLNAYIYG